MINKVSSLSVINIFVKPLKPNPSKLTSSLNSIIKLMKSTFFIEFAEAQSNRFYCCRLGCLLLYKKKTSVVQDKSREEIKEVNIM